MQPRRPKRKRGATRQARMSWGPFIIVGVGAIAVVVAIILGSAVLRGGGGNTERTTPRKALVLGAEDAPVTVVEYFSFYCSHCGDFALETTPLIEEEFILDNRVRFEVYPMAVEGDLLTVSEAAICASDQNRGWEYHDVLFAEFAKDSLDAYSLDRLKGYAAQLGLDTESFDSCLDSQKYQQTVIEESKQAIEAGIQSTPTFFIGLTEDMKAETAPYAGEKSIVGAETYDVFKAAIEEVLKKAQ